MARIIAIANQKGGVGKTTTALNLLAAIGQARQRPFAIDLDPQCHLSHIFGVQPKSADAERLLEKERTLRANLLLRAQLEQEHGEEAL